ncbi:MULTISPECIES: hypothetical protein [unclassified Brevundimonas]|uniref:hypothetical protein n=2 Tax=Brevundimonas TaxID=41275 RepID=UPI00257F2441|nr:MULTISPECIES: hypothetical protein [unclassified Brevundimonas]
MTLTHGAEASNKPPVPTPSPEDYPVHLTFSDGREVWVSAPKPDRISLIAPLKHSHFIPEPTGEEQFAELIKTLSSFMAMKEGPTDLVDTQFSQPEKLYEKVWLSAGEREAGVFVQFIRPKEAQPWKLRLEFNPRKIGPGGLQALTEELSYAKTFRIDRFLADCRLTRLDIAVDFIGVAVSEIVASASLPGKTTFYVGDDGSLETMQLHRNNPAPKQTYSPTGEPKKVKRSTDPLGPVVAKLYDKVKERASVLQPAPFGPAPVTRVEIVKRWKGGGPRLVELIGHKNLLTGLNVGYAGHLPPTDLHEWLTYVASRRTMAKDLVDDAMKLGIPKTILLNKRYKQPPSSLLLHEELWSRWPDGLSSTGLGYWITLAAQAPLITFEGGQS